MVQHAEHLLSLQGQYAGKLQFLVDKAKCMLTIVEKRLIQHDEKIVFEVFKDMQLKPEQQAAVNEARALYEYLSANSEMLIAINKAGGSILKCYRNKMPYILKYWDVARNRTKKRWARNSWRTSKGMSIVTGIVALLISLL